MFLEILKAILMGIVEGITEWLPISSTGHMILVEQVVKFNASEEFMSMFRVVIQLGAILAVVVLFWNKLWPFGIRHGRAPAATISMSRRSCERLSRRWRRWMPSITIQRSSCIR